MRFSFIWLEHVILLSMAILCLWLFMKDCEEDVEDSPVLPQPTTRRVGSSCQEDPTARSISGFASLPPHIQEFLKYKHCRDFPQILDAPMKCGGRNRSHGVFLLLAIKTSPLNYERRAVLRETWAKEKSYNGARVQRVFLSGTSRDQREDRRSRPLLKAESEVYGDILQWDFYDTFFNLTLKQVLFHQWLVKNCPGAHFIMNGDDDVFVNTFNVVTYLHDISPDSHLCVGHLIANNPVVRYSGSKYYIPVQVLSATVYPNYISGGGILMSRYTAHVIYNKSWEIPLIPIDDAYLGMCLEKAGLVPVSHMAMSILGLTAPPNINSFDPCFYRHLIMVHRFLSIEMMIMWHAVQDPNLHCGQKHTY